MPGQMIGDEEERPRISSSSSARGAARTADIAAHHPGAGEATGWGKATARLLHDDAPSRKAAGATLWAPICERRGTADYTGRPQFWPAAPTDLHANARASVVVFFHSWLHCCSSCRHSHTTKLSAQTYIIGYNLRQVSIKYLK